MRAAGATRKAAIPAMNRRLETWRGPPLRVAQRPSDLRRPSSTVMCRQATTYRLGISTRNRTVRISPAATVIGPLALPTTSAAPSSEQPSVSPAAASAEQVDNTPPLSIEMSWPAPPYWPSRKVTSASIVSDIDTSVASSDPVELSTVIAYSITAPGSALPEPNGSEKTE